MVDSLLDDIKELMLKEKGDQKVLEQIKRAAENNEVISIHERDYVKKLAETYLDKRKFEEKRQAHPDVKLPSELEKPKSIPSQTLQYPQQSGSAQETLKQKNTKLMLAIGVAALVVVIVAGLGMSEMNFTQSNPTPTTTKSPTPSSGLVLATDLESYDKGDIISISGNTDPLLSDTINLSIENFDGEVVWLEEVKVKSSGKFSTLAIAGGPGWENSGDYVLKAEHADKKGSVSFRYNS
ncbi:MAG: hypothetical protein GWN01_05665 [Nitrosopumilaceae archaeon]|nr:hypothetical protein [Nitrosopumilaceae archaeon]NIU00429.1 hypothetical protein [Nitrosopumilaceae archaeon]NIU87106.1 hypothetical protein [Nitrosopumilaceae archaeon]NIV65661.1 hypothetical protein [Nitrosopumilaceae archaeon]NIX61031.1 hypothetical protein [Nitrosopumilaceae archaeon]